MVNGRSLSQKKMVLFRASLRQAVYEEPGPCPGLHRITGQLLWSIKTLQLKAPKSNERVLESRALALLEADVRKAINSQTTRE